LRGVQQLGRGVELFGPIHLQNLGYIEIGQHVELRSSWHRPISISVVNPAGSLIIEDGVFVNWGVTMGVMKSITIGALSQIGDDCVLYDTDWHSLDGTDRNVIVAPTRIGRGVWLGARVMVLRGVTIGDNSVVAANSVVTTDLPAGILAAGAPAHVIREIQRNRYPGVR
jgi:maltose O-acetyltransferase